MLLNCCIREASWESLGQQGDQTSQSLRKSVLNIHWKEWCKLKLQYFVHLTWRTIYWKRPWCWERLKAGEGDDRGWDGWMASLTQWIWVWATSGSCWWTHKPGVMQSMGSQRVGHDLATELTDWPAERVWSHHPSGSRSQRIEPKRCILGPENLLKFALLNLRPAWDTSSIPSFCFLPWIWNVFPMPVPPLYYGIT